MADAARFLEAWRTRDLALLDDLFADDVRLRSPVLSTAFEGRGATLELFEVLFAAFGEIEFTSQFDSPDETALYWRVDLAGRTVQGSDLVRFDSEGRIVEMTVMIRPLRDIGRFVAVVGPRLARRRGPVQALLVRLFSLPLRATLALNDVLAPKLAMRRRPA